MLWLPRLFRSCWRLESDAYLAAKTEFPSDALTTARAGAKDFRSS